MIPDEFPPSEWLRKEIKIIPETMAVCFVLELPVSPSDVLSLAEYWKVKCYRVSPADVASIPPDMTIVYIRANLGEELQLMRINDPSEARPIYRLVNTPLPALLRSGREVIAHWCQWLTPSDLARLNCVNRALYRRTAKDYRIWWNSTVALQSSSKKKSPLLPCSEQLQLDIKTFERLGPKPVLAYQQFVRIHNIMARLFPLLDEEEGEDRWDLKAWLSSGSFSIDISLVAPFLTEELIDAISQRLPSASMRVIRQIIDF